ncbi:VOC family protein [uncultured Desulfosarcina sp.]|uniref:VOC family protein n=1 Tax=uncultured Desulfosarcina sp. TaxID=218289 RepID=UPI0029C831CF|nr:VOC family protein [uncultured Desulfosarcina sp.]
MIKKIDHIGIIVKDIEEGKKQFSDGLGLEMESEEISHEYNCKIAFFPCGEVMLELVEPLGPGAILDFLEKCGGGLHHICYRVANIEETMKKTSKNFILKDKEPRPGAQGSKVFFLDPESILNIETEFVERADTKS